MRRRDADDRLDFRHYFCRMLRAGKMFPTMSVFAHTLPLRTSGASVDIGITYTLSPLLPESRLH